MATQIVNDILNLIGFCFMAPIIFLVLFIVLTLSFRWAACKNQAAVLKRKNIDITAGELFWGATPHEQVIHLKEKKDEQS